MPSIEANPAVSEAPPKSAVPLHTLVTTIFKPAIPYLFLLLASALYLYPFLRVLTWNPDEGIYLYGAQMVTHGAIPSRDFIELQGPGSFYWLALFFKLFGTTLLTARAALMVTALGTALPVFHLSRRILGVGLFAAIFVLATSIPLGVMNSPHYDSNLFALLAFAVFVHAERSGKAVPIFAAGALAGVTSCFLQQKGCYLAASFVVAVLLLHPGRRLRSAALISSGFAVIVATEITLYAAAKALPSLAYANLIWPLSTYEKVNAAPYGFTLREGLVPGWFAALHASFPIPIALVGTIIFSVPYVLILAVPFLLPVIGLAWRSNAFRRELLSYWISGYALWASELHRPDLGHLRNGCVILIVLFFAVCDRQQKIYARQLTVAIIACLVVTASANVLGAWSQQTPIHTRRGTLYERQNDPALQFLLAHTKRGETVFVYPYQPIYYFVADLRNPTRFSNLMYGINTDAQFHEVVQDLDAQKVRYVLWDSKFSGQKLKSLFPAYEHPPPAHLIIEPYLETHYRQIAFENGFRILERRP